MKECPGRRPGSVVVKPGLASSDLVYPRLKGNCILPIQSGRTPTARRLYRTALHFEFHFPGAVPTATKSFGESHPMPDAGAEPGPKRNNAPDPRVLGRCSQAWPGGREIGISRFRAGEFRPLEVLSDHP